MNPFIVNDVMTPTNHKKSSATKHVHSIYRHLIIQNFATAVSRLRASWVTAVPRSSMSTRHKVGKAFRIN
jgi:hypothetical protein